MRAYINLFEDAGTVTLYRGDGTKIDKFDVEKTDENALLGIGIYLTDNPDVAKDYTIKGGNNIVFRPREPIHDAKELTAACIQDLLNGLGLSEKLETMKQEWQQRFYKETAAIDWTDQDKAREERQKQSEAFTERYRKERSTLIRKEVQKAKAIFKEARKNMRVAKLTTGEYVFTSVDRDAAVSKFEVPKSYLARCLHSEQPVPDDILPILKDAFKRASPTNDSEQMWDLRANDDSMRGLTFDQFVDAFKKHGSRYAWTDNYLGGKGQNPSLDFFWNGTHSGYHVFQRNKEFQKALIADLMAKGYVGLEYDGGIRAAGTMARGGGGVRHQAFVFWDADKINSFRVDDHGFEDDEVGELEKGLRANKIYR